MITVAVQITKGGFQYKVEGLAGTWFHFDYVCVSSGGQHLYGSMAGIVGSEPTWSQCDTRAVPIFVGITNLAITENQPAQPYIRPRPATIMEGSLHPMIHTPLSLGGGLLADLAMNRNNAVVSADGENDPYPYPYPYYPFNL